MLRILIAACALLCAFLVAPAEARQRAADGSCVETGDIMRPVCGMAARRAAISVATVSSFGVPSPDLAYSIARPARYIAGRLICAVNVNSALAERGIKGTGSAAAKSFLHWGRPSAPVPGAVAVSSRRGGGHVAIVSRVEGGRIYVWNPSPRGRGWQEQAYRYRAISFRVPG
jgi:hypothetical protein